MLAKATIFTDGFHYLFKNLLLMLHRIDLLCIKIVHSEFYIHRLQGKT